MVSDEFGTVYLHGLLSWAPKPKKRYVGTSILELFTGKTLLMEASTSSMVVLLLTNILDTTTETETTGGN